MLLCPDYEGSRQYVLKHLRDIDPSLITFAGWASRRDYLNRYNQIDIALDPIPFNGHTTTCDALWMGAPVVMLCGSSYVSRFGAVAIKAVGLDDLVTQNAQDYIATATRLAQDVDRLRLLRSSLRDRLTRSIVCDAKAFSAILAACYRSMWKSWCAAGDVKPA